MKRFTILLTLLIVGFSIVTAQEETKELPYSFSQKGISSNIDEIILPFIDNAELLREDASNTNKARLLRVGVGHNTEYTLKNCGRTDILADGGKLWRANFVSKDAVMMSLVFDIFNLPAEGKMFIYSPDREQVFGPYTNADIQEVGRVATEDIIGDELILEYYEPANAEFSGDFRIKGIMHKYKDFLHQAETKTERGPHGSAEGTCHLDVVCPEGAEWHNPINSVVCIEITAYVPSEGGWAAYLCTGAMINNARMDKTPYVLSANHCVAAADQTHKFYFKYETYECGGSNGRSGWVSNGGTIVARSNESTDENNYSSSSDFLLLKITGMISPVFRDSIFFAGWDRSGGASIGAGIHHPGGDYKKISLPQSVNTINSGSLKNKYFLTYWRSNPNKGVTEQGSSGSPLFNNNSLIIGTLTAGSSGCNYTGGSDLYGRLAYHWLNNGATDNKYKLQPWLDPDNTGVMAIKGMSYNGDVFTGIDDRQDVNNMTIAPNPVTTDLITVEGDFFTENAVCSIYNMMGQLVKTMNIETSSVFTINVNDLTNGVYIVDIQGSQRNYKSKIIIAK